jgi:uncharacterized OsmC-like protein
MTTSSPSLTADPTPKVKHVRASGTWQGRMSTAVQIRDFDPVLIGEPAKVGGDDQAPTPMEYVVAALNGCLAVVIETVAAERGIPLDALTLDADATMDTRGFAGTADVDPYFTDVKVVASLTSDASVEEIGQLRAAVERRCPALTLIVAAGVPVDLDLVHLPGGDSVSVGDHTEQVRA